jgi:hypothetical protein
MGLSTINIGECESQLAWVKGNLNGERRQVFIAWEKREKRVWSVGA